MQTSAELLRFAMHALRDIEVGYPASELGCPPGPQDEKMPRASGLAKMVGAIALHLAASGDLTEGDRNVVVGLLPDLIIPAPTKAELIQAKRDHALRMIQDANLSYADCVRALGGVDCDTDRYAQAAVRKYAEGSDNDIEIDDTAMLSVGDDGAWVAAWVWVSNTEAGVHPWDDVLESFRDKFQEFKQDAITAPLIAELADKMVFAPTNVQLTTLLDLFDQERDTAKTRLGAEAANACLDDEDEEAEAISAAEEFFDAHVDNSFADNIAVVLYNMGADGELAIRKALVQDAPAMPT